MPYTPNENWSAICKTCNIRFSLGQQGHDEEKGAPYWKEYMGPVSDYKLHDTITFPKNPDTSIIEATCSLCDQRFEYKSNDLIRPGDIYEAELRENRAAEKRLQLEDKIRTLENQVKALENDKQFLMEQVKDKDLQIGKFADGYMTIAKFVQDRTGSSENSQPVQTAKNPLTG